MERYIHSNLIRNRNETVVLVKTHDHLEDKVEPRLRIIKNPKRRFWLTKKHLREVHNEKREWENIENLDEYHAFDHELSRSIFKALNGYENKGYVNLRDLCKSPYLYGADISMEVLINHAYSEKFNLDPNPLTKGMFDIEADIDTDEITIMSLTHENEIYTTINKKYFSRNGKPGNLKDLEKMLHLYLNPSKEFKNNKTIMERIQKTPFTHIFHLGDTPIEMIKWIFSKVHENKTDFIGVWNLPYDIGQIIKVCKAENYPLENLFSSPELPDDLKTFMFKIDPGRLDKKNDHFTRRWHWIYNSSHTKWLDAMCLYSILRIVSGYEISYSLDYILRKNGISDGKLNFKDHIPFQEDLSRADWHRLMTKEHFYEYIIYNIFDVMSMQAMEWVNNDISAMHILAFPTALQDFNKQTIKIKNQLYFKCLDIGKVIATSSPFEPDMDISRIGGAVLHPENTYKAGLFALRENPSHETWLHAHTNDIDLSASYPSNTMACNISRETKKFTAISMDNSREDLQKLMTDIIHADENAVELCNKFFNLPTYKEMESLVRKKYKERNIEYISSS